MKRISNIAHAYLLSTGGVALIRTVNDDLPREPRIHNAREVGAQFPLGVDIVLPVHLLEMHEKITRYVLILVCCRTK